MASCGVAEAIARAEAAIGASAERLVFHVTLAVTTPNVPPRVTWKQPGLSAPSLPAAGAEAAAEAVVRLTGKRRRRESVEGPADRGGNGLPADLVERATALLREPLAFFGGGLSAAEHRLLDTVVAARGLRAGRAV